MLHAPSYAEQLLIDTDMPLRLRLSPGGSCLFSEPLLCCLTLRFEEKIKKQGR